MMRLGFLRMRHRRAAVAMALAAAAASVLVALASPAEAARRKHRPGGGGGGYSPPFAAMVVDVKTGRTLHAVNEDAPRHPASITKVMTLYLLFEQLEKGRMTLDTPLKVTAAAASAAPSKLYLDAGDSISVEDAIKAVVTKSANDVAVTIAENISGSEEDFAELMTRKARALGMTRTVYRNASGLPDPEQTTTARDLTILARAIQDRFPKYYPYFQTRVFRFAGASIGNHNRLIGRVEGVDGIKTGFTRASGFNLMTNAKTEDRHIVAILLGGRSGGSRDQAVAALVRANLPRAYAGARIAPLVTEGGSALAAADRAVPALRRSLGADVDSTAGTTPLRPIAEPLALRPVVVSAAGAGTATPSSSRWATGPGQAPLPINALAYASLPSAPDRTLAIGAAGKIEDRLPATPTPAARPEPKAEAPEPKREARAERDAQRAPASPWVIQLGATDEESKAKEILAEAKSRSGKALAGAAPFTERVLRDGATLYRARFSGFDEAEEAQDACKALKRSGFACFATRS